MRFHSSADNYQFADNTDAPKNASENEKKDRNSFSYLTCYKTTAFWGLLAFFQARLLFSPNVALECITIHLTMHSGETPGEGETSHNQVEAAGAPYSPQNAAVLMCGSVPETPQIWKTMFTEIRGFL